MEQNGKQDKRAQLNYLVTYL